MAAFHHVTEDDFLCSICLKALTDPVTIPCGHNFCKSCISEIWRIKVPYQCHMCRVVFTTKPQLKVNTLLSELLAYFRQEQKAELRRVQRHEVDVTLDPDTADYNVILSGDGKQARYGNKRKNPPDNPQRFTNYPCVVAKQSFSSDRFYFEVQIKGTIEETTTWFIGVVRESIERKEPLTLGPYGLWTIGLTDLNTYWAFADTFVPLSVSCGLQKVGVFVDYEGGLVSFYDVESSARIYAFTGCHFSDKLLPLLYVEGDGTKNSAFLIITPVDTE